MSNAFMQSRLQDNEALTRLQQAIIQLQSQLERLNNLTQELTDESSNHRKNIEVSRTLFLYLPFQAITEQI